MPRKKTGLASSTKKRYIKSTCHCLILCQNIVGGLYTIISEGKFTQSKVRKTIDILFEKCYTITRFCENPLKAEDDWIKDYALEEEI